MISSLIYLCSALFRPPVGFRSRKKKRKKKKSNQKNPPALWILSFPVEIGRETKSRVWKTVNGSQQEEPCSPYNDQPARLLLRCRNSSFVFKITRRLLDLMDSLIFPPVPYYSIHASCYRGRTVSNVAQPARRVLYKHCVFVSVLRTSIHFLV